MPISVPVPCSPQKLSNSGGSSITLTYDRKGFGQHGESRNIFIKAMEINFFYWVHSLAYPLFALFI
jgi:hypothetical protein